jgi:hypothetical protein
VAVLGAFPALQQLKLKLDDGSMQQVIHSRIFNDSP